MRSQFEKGVEVLVVTTYTLNVSALLLVGGRAADLLGRRRTFTRAHPGGGEPIAIRRRSW
jgi:hypothetical protein